MMEEERKENQSEEHSGENSQETNQNGSALPVSIKLTNSINISRFWACSQEKYCWVISTGSSG